jgi:hypothetical protein
MDCVYQVINRHNEKIALKKANPSIQFMLKIPLISSIALWIFNRMMLTKPNSSLEAIQTHQQHLFKKQFSSASELEKLVVEKGVLINKAIKSFNKLKVYSEQDLKQEAKKSKILMSMEIRNCLRFFWRQR